MLINGNSNLFEITSKAQMGSDVFYYNNSDKFNDRITLAKYKKNIKEKMLFDVVFYNYDASARIVRENFRKYASKNKISKNKNYIFLYTQNDFSYYKDLDNQKALLRFLDTESNELFVDNANFYFLDKINSGGKSESYFFLKSTAYETDLRDLYNKDRFFNNDFFWIENEAFSKIAGDNEIIYELYPEYRVLVQNDCVCLTESQEKYFKSKGFSPLNLKDLGSIDFPLIDLFLTIKNKKKIGFFKRHKDLLSFDRSLYGFLSKIETPSIQMLERYESIIINKFGKNYKEKYDKIRESLNKALIANIRKKDKFAVMCRNLGIDQNQAFVDE